jgi:hypothetical protein
MSLTVNYLAVLVATIAGFATGAIWYTVLFSKPWLKAVGPIEPMGCRRCHSSSRLSRTR